jgi:4-diphosphocytidyl-2-C-methyl-D-erythritol kinase
MQVYSLNAPAKINLYLEILGDRPDGFHELAMVLQSIDLSDRVELRANGTDTIRLHCNHPQVPLDESNLAYRAARLVAQQFPEEYENLGGVDITIDKQIPVAAGLAGGSTDAAAVLVGLNLMWQLGLTQPELQLLGATLGSDVPFCVAGGTMLATGRGEQLAPLPDLNGLFIVLGKHRNLEVSTGWAYKTFREQFSDRYVRDDRGLQQQRQRVHSGPMVAAVTQQDGAKIGELLYNDLESVILPAYPPVARLRQAFEEAGSLGTMMSGSGPSVFALCESEARAQQIQQTVQTALADSDLDLWITRLSSAGIGMTR